jgi:hypothetical protein
LIGESAKNQLDLNPLNTIFGMSKLWHRYDIKIHNLCAGWRKG